MVIAAEIYVLPLMDGYIKLCIWGAVIFIINCLIAGIISFTINYKCSFKNLSARIGLDFRPCEKTLDCILIQSITAVMAQSVKDISTYKSRNPMEICFPYGK